MKSAFIVSAAKDLCEQAAAALVEAGATSAAGGVAQIADEHGRLFTLFGHAGPAFADALLRPPGAVRGAGTPPDLRAASTCYVECRWEDLFIDWVHRIATRVQDPVWVLDGADVLWLAEELDANELRL